MTKETNYKRRKIQKMAIQDQMTWAKLTKKTWYLQHHTLDQEEKKLKQRLHVAIIRDQMVDMKLQAGRETGEHFFENKPKYKSVAIKLDFLQNIWDLTSKSLNFLE